MNPRPTLLREGFSGRSPRRPYSASPVLRTCWCDRPSRCLLSLKIPRPDLSVILLADVRFGAEKDPVQRIPYSLRRRGRNLAQLVCWHLFFCNGWLTRSSLPSSARFPTLDERCRDRSPPKGEQLHQHTWSRHRGVQVPVMDGRQVAPAEPGAQFDTARECLRHLAASLSSPSCPWTAAPRTARSPGRRPAWPWSAACRIPSCPCQGRVRP